MYRGGTWTWLSCGDAAQHLGAEKRAVLGDVHEVAAVLLSSASTSESRARTARAEAAQHGGPAQHADRL